MRRQGRVWWVREGTYYTFHLEPSLDEDAELAVVLAEVDARYPRLRELGIPPMADDLACCAAFLASMTRPGSR